MPKPTYGVAKATWVHSSVRSPPRAGPAARKRLDHAFPQFLDHLIASLILGSLISSITLLGSLVSSILGSLERLENSQSVS